MSTFTQWYLIVIATFTAGLFFTHVLADPAPRRGPKRPPSAKPRDERSDSRGSE
jgi:hypothetical protein